LLTIGIKVNTNPLAEGIQPTDHFDGPACPFALDERQSSMISYCFIFNLQTGNQDVDCVLAFRSGQQIKSCGERIRHYLLVKFRRILRIFSVSERFDLF